MLRVENGQRNLNRASCLNLCLLDKNVILLLNRPHKVHIHIVHCIIYCLGFICNTDVITYLCAE